MGKYEFTSIKELLQKELEASRWLVEGLVPSSGITVLSGAPASFKTWFVLEMIRCVAAGSDFLDKFKTVQTGVLLIDEESGERLLQERLRIINADGGLPVHFLSYSNFKLAKNSVKEMIKALEEKNISFVIFDSLVRIHTQDENDAGGMAKVAEILREFSKAEITVLFTHHNRKPGAMSSGLSYEMRGSSDILASVDCHIAVERRGDSLIITQTKLRSAVEMKPFKLGIPKEGEEFKLAYLGESTPPMGKGELVEFLVRDWVRDSESPLCKDDLFRVLKEGKLLKCGKGFFNGVVDELVVAGVIKETKSVKNKVLLSWVQEEGV